MRIKAIIIDDESMARSLLNAMLTNHCPEIEIVDECKDLASGVKSIHKNKPQLVFLDIEMPGHSGLELLDFFDEKEVDFSIIFTTAYNHYAIQAFKLSAVDYLLKPIEPEELENAIERYKKNTDKKDYSVLKQNLSDTSPLKIGLPTSNSIKFVNVDDIIYLKADGSYTHVFIKNGISVTVCKNLKYFEDILISSPGQFFRCHKSYIVNISTISDWVKSDGGYLILSNGDQVSLSSEKSTELLTLLNIAKR